MNSAADMSKIVEERNAELLKRMGLPPNWQVFYYAISIDFVTEEYEEVFSYTEEDGTRERMGIMFPDEAIEYIKEASVCIDLPSGLQLIGAKDPESESKVFKFVNVEGIK